MERNSDTVSTPQGQAKPAIILVAEDDRINQLVARKMLGTLFPKARVIEAVDGEQAVALYREHQPDLILMDLQMPRLDGYAATRVILEEARSSGRHTRVVALTAGLVHGERERCIEAGMSEFLSKPLDQDRLKTVVESLIDPALL